MIKRNACWCLNTFLEVKGKYLSEMEKVGCSERGAVVREKRIFEISFDFSVFFSHFYPFIGHHCDLLELVCSNLLLL